MKKFTSLILTLLIFSSAITPAVLAGEENKSGKKVNISESINDYKEDLFDLNKKIAKVYQELNDSQKSGNDESTYVNIVETAEETAELIGKTNQLAKLLLVSGFETASTSLSNQLLDVAVNGFSPEVKDKLLQAGYTEQDIATLEKKITEYNAYLYRISTQGFNSEEIQNLRNAGYTDTDMENLRNRISQRYSTNFTATEQLNASKNELYQVEVMLSILSLKLLINSTEEKGKISQEQIEHLGKLEKKLLEDIAKLNTEEKWNKIRDDGKELYKYSEMLIKKSGNVSAFSVDYFIGMQTHLAAITALEGDEGFALNVINSYKHALEDLANKHAAEKEEKDESNEKSEKSSNAKVKVVSFIKPISEFANFKWYKISSGIKAFVLKASSKLFSIPIVKALSPIIGQVDEIREDNNIAEITVQVPNSIDPLLSSMILAVGVAYEGGYITIILTILEDFLNFILSTIVPLLEAFALAAGLIIGIIIVAEPVGYETVPLPIPVPESWKDSSDIIRIYNNPELGEIDLTKGAWYHIQQSGHTEITEEILVNAITEDRKPRIEIWKNLDLLRFMIVWKGDDTNVYVVAAGGQEIITAFMAGKFPNQPIPPLSEQWNYIARKVCLTVAPEDPLKYPVHIYGDIADPLKPYKIVTGGAVCE